MRPTSTGPTPSPRCGHPALASLVTPLLCAVVGLSACNRAATPPPPGEGAESRTVVQPTPVAAGGAAPANKGPIARAQASMAPIGDSKVVGTLMLIALPDDAGVRVQGALSGLTPGAHGIHVHEVGDCSSADGMAAGGHYNPTAAPHGAIEAAQSHVGDLGNVVADAAGRATFDVIKKAATLGGGAADLVGRSIIVHAGADDLHSQPAGASGARVACGVVQKL